MSWASDELRAFGDAVEAGQSSKIKEPEPTSWSDNVGLGHQFHFQVMVQGAHRGADGLYHDEPEPVEYEPFTLTVRAWNLRDACAQAAATPLKGWKHAGEEL